MIHFEAVIHRRDGSFALGSSTLTGQVWDGNIWVFKTVEEFRSCPNLFMTNTRTSAGLSDLMWLDGEQNLLVASDTGELEIWSCSPLGNSLELSGYLKSHDSMALCICRLGGGVSERVVSGGADGRVILWDVACQQQVENYRGHLDMVLSVGGDPFSEVFITSSQDGSVRLWDFRLPKPARNLEACKSGVCTSVAWGKNSLAIGNERGEVQLIDPRNDHCLLSKYQPHSRAIHRLTFAPWNSNLLASVSDDSTVQVHCIDSSEIVYSHLGHRDFVRGASWEGAYDGGFGLLTCAWDGQLVNHKDLLHFSSDDLPSTSSMEIESCSNPMIESGNECVTEMLQTEAKEVDGGQ